MTKETWLKQVERVMPGGTVALDQRGHIDILVPCSAGDHTVTIPLTKRTAPDHLRKLLPQRGWVMTNGGKRGTCPECARTCREAPKEEKPMPEKPKLTAVPKPAPSDNARRARRDALSWLDEAFSPETGRYRAGVSDATIAAEVGLSEAMVAALREEFYGPLKEPEEVVELRETLARLTRDVEAAKTLVADLDRRVAAAQSKLDAAAKANGW